MTSPFFSTIGAQSTQAVTASKQMPMKEGQVVHGVIKKLYPNQTAEVQIGNQKVIAKLETPLKAGDAHFFQVSKASPEVQLKVVTGPLTGGNTLAQQATQLLQAMNLTKTNEMQAVTQFFLKEQLPISKELLIQAEQLLKQLPPGTSIKAALEGIQKMTELKLPLTTSLLEAVLSGKSTRGLQSSIESFKLALLQDSTISQAVKTDMQQSLQKIAEPFRLPVAGAIIGKQLETLQNQQTSISKRLPILQTLKEAGVLPAVASLSNPTPILSQPSLPNSAGQWMTKLVQAAPTEKGVLKEQLRNWINAQPLLIAGQKEQVLSLIKENSEAQPIQNALVKAFAEQSGQAIFQKDTNGLTAKEHLVTLLGKGQTVETVNQILHQVNMLVKSNSNSFNSQSMMESEQAALKQLDGKAFEHALKEVLKSLGFSYEAKLGTNSEEIRNIAHQLKPQLVELVQNHAIAASLRESAEMLLGRMNGLQILSGESGPQHQLLMQVPLEFFGKKMDATLEWNGRMKEDGKIDSDFARIMFYLKLETLDETVVDMQVQNRIVTINVYNNDAQLQHIANTFKNALKDGLSSVGYTLSGVFMKTFEEQKLASKIQSKGASKQSQGVDIRI
ncbi:hypothetical protein [Psychrobacillus lasiicapitis]|uniref:Uncharacterized protein n=1 Tax=Psychrobacillus lasiicapitis TaxID=1636719 RepID=A0A544TF55_9BACI|nr:hypothetical protein [Psychrobacillus lasiicapitis]TQR16026.1 hypothetical protein FG382_04755 [Psychrobacillus lasiicapitis]GGA16266.1 hypothetical protein GCM10011384_01370 [Psychrobacillus lasiicapitis]